MYKNPLPSNQLHKTNALNMEKLFLLVLEIRICDYPTHISLFGGQADPKLRSGVSVGNHKLCYIGNIEHWNIQG